MTIPDEAIQKGSVTFYADSDAEILKAVDEYNAKMSANRGKRKRAEEVRFGFAVLNPLVIGALTLTQLSAVFSTPLLAAALLAVNLIAYIVFTLYQEKLIVSTFAAALLIILDWKFAILFAADIILFSAHYLLLRTLKNQRGYPVFPDIKVKYERHNHPN